MIPLYKTHYPQGLGAILQKVFDSGNTTEGKEAADFQVDLQKWMENPFVALTNSGTTALEISGALSNIKPGDEVIASPVTCTAGLQWILKMGAIPVWCDVDPNTGCIDANKIKPLITSKTKAITFVDWAGIPAELDDIQSIANEHGLKTIEDGAQSMGATYKGQKIGRVCDFTIHSFQSIKILSTADGGCISCKNGDDYKRAILLRWFGLARGTTSNPVCWTGDIFEPGWKGHMNNINAAVGIEQLKYVDTLIEKHRQNALYLLDSLKFLSNKVLAPVVPDYVSPNYWVFTIRLLNKQHRLDVSNKLTEAGIGNNISHVRNDKYSLFKGFEKELPCVDDYEDRRLNIPCGWWCKPEDMSYIVDVLKKIC